MIQKIAILFFVFSMNVSQLLKAQNLYFPPNIGNTWDTISPSSLGWCTNYLDTLENLLQQRQTKAFIILKDGKIAYEKYFGTFTQDSIWYWASAAKTLTAFAVGQAQEQGFLNINDSTSKYLGSNFTNCPANKEGLITIRHQLTMSSGLDDNLANSDCYAPSCLQYLTDAGNRWAYHNAPYSLLQLVLDSACGNFNTFFNQKLRNKIGMNGLWLSFQPYVTTYYSTPRSMARFGLLLLNKGIWQNDTLMHDTSYFQAMTNTSQNLNLSYGYLTWLNGKQSFMLPQSQFVFSGSVIPNAPPDLFAALGKNDEKIHVVPSQNLVIVRMGNAGNANLSVPIVLDTEIWDVLNNVFCTSTKIERNDAKSINKIINLNDGNFLLENNFDDDCKVEIIDLSGTKIQCTFMPKKSFTKIDLSNFSKGIYFVEFSNKTAIYTTKFVIK